MAKSVDTGLGTSHHTRTKSAILKLETLGEKQSGRVGRGIPNSYTDETDEVAALAQFGSDLDAATQADGIQSINPEMKPEAAGPPDCWTGTTDEKLLRITEKQLNRIAEERNALAEKAFERATFFGMGLPGSPQDQKDSIYLIHVGRSPFPYGN
ncbi:hypothetical protein KY290_008043 [Solanum tuberosum]|uniref:Integrase core domain containing protein n=1 Tax=Solanum tuberosum TaxID=4113 RepID=A0ABQ7W7A8_SOLTU|nr:hypothetical protein KY290_008043 [Solanum tuberosum]